MDDEAAPGEVTHAELDRLELQAVHSGRYGEIARLLLHWAKWVAPRSEVSRVELLVRAGQHHEIAGEYAEALAAYRQATTEGGDTPVDPRALQLGPLLELGERAEADRLLEQLAAEGARNLPTYITITETLYSHGELSSAHDWATLGIRRFQAQDISPYIHSLLLTLLRTRFRIGVDMGRPEDSLDRRLDE